MSAYQGWLLKFDGGLHGRLLLRRNLFVVERAARHGHHQDEGDAGNDQNGDEGHDHPFHNVFCHSFTSHIILCSRNRNCPIVSVSPFYRNLSHASRVWPSKFDGNSP